MKPGLTKLACGVVLGGAFGFVLGYLVPASRVATSSKKPAGDWASFDPQADFPDIVDDRGSIVDTEPSEPAPVYFPDHTQELDRAVAAINTTVLVDADSTPPEDYEPGALPAGHDASPITSGEPEDVELQQLLDAELADVSGEDRQVWLDVLRGLPPQDALGILRLWKQFGTRTAASPSSPAGSARPLVSAPSAHALSDIGSPTGREMTDPVVLQLKAARTVLIENLSHSWTAGHQRIEPILRIPAGQGVEADQLSPLAVSAVDELQPRISTRIDLTPGELSYTARPLDVAIGGMGFFVVQRDGQTLFTRAGRFDLDDDRRLILADRRLSCVIQPEITIPEDVTQITIDQYGTVAVAGGELEEKKAIGQMQLALFLDPTKLTPLDASLYSANENSGPASVDRPARANRGLLSQYHLEASNTSFETERQRIQHIDELIDLLNSDRPSAN